jgi:antitoxin (DNA-binding transcriptional repressor) of toxin-antitoxin stability system
LKQPKYLGPLTSAASSCTNLLVKTISVHEAETHLPLYLAALEKGEEFIIAQGEKALGRLIPIVKDVTHRRPKVGETLDQPLSIPDSVFSPLTEEELKVWYGE